MCTTKCEPHRRRPDQGCQFGCALSDCSLASWPSLSSPHRETGVCVAAAEDTVLCWRRILQLRSPVPRQMRSIHEPVDVSKNINVQITCGQAVIFHIQLVSLVGVLCLFTCYLCIQRAQIKPSRLFLNTDAPYIFVRRSHISHQHSPMYLHYILLMLCK